MKSNLFHLLSIFQLRGPFKKRRKAQGLLSASVPTTHFPQIFITPDGFSKKINLYMSGRGRCLSPQLSGKGGIQKCPREVQVLCIWAGLFETKMFCSCPEPGLHRNKTSSPSCLIFCLLSSHHANDDRQDGNTSPVPPGLLAPVFIPSSG